MKISLKVSILIFSVMIMPSKEVYAFFPIPIPLIGTDIPNNATDLIENINATAEVVEEEAQNVQKTIESAKSGQFGLLPIESFKSTLNSINIDRIVPEIELPEGLAKNINNSEKATQSVKNTYIGTFTEGGDHMQEAKINNLKRTELMHMNIAALYAHALAIRVNLAKEREMPETELKQENTREILQANRAVEDKILKRWNEILFMEAQIAEYKSTKKLAGTVLTPEQAEDRGVNSGADVKSDEEEASEAKEGEKNDE